MDDTATPLRIAQRARELQNEYLIVAGTNRDYARRLLDLEPPDFSTAATACHRALQFTRQAEALEQLAKDVGLWT